MSWRPERPLPPLTNQVTIDQVVISLGILLASIYDDPIVAATTGTETWSLSPQPQRAAFCVYPYWNITANMMANLFMSFMLRKLTGEAVYNTDVIIDELGLGYMPTLEDVLRRSRTRGVNVFAAAQKLCIQDTHILEYFDIVEFDKKIGNVS